MTNDTPHLKKDWVPNKESFDSLLACLDEDRERAAELYVTIRARLVKYFEWRGCLTQDELADETINRVTRKISEGESIQNLQSYFYGVARMLFMETLKEQEKQRQALDHLLLSVPFVEDRTETEARIVCFDTCLGSLPEENRHLILEYFEGEGRARIERRKALGEGLKVSLNALRIIVHRIRNELEQCVEKCMGHPVGEMK
jgi:DNA-directed RNA polymerase specialized sigma24 family protein